MEYSKGKLRRGKVYFTNCFHFASTLLSVVSFALWYYQCVMYQVETEHEKEFSVLVYFRCTSYVGKTGRRQDISLGRGCWTKGVVAHEIGKSSFCKESNLFHSLNINILTYLKLLTNICSVAIRIRDHLFQSTNVVTHTFILQSKNNEQIFPEKIEMF